MNLEPNEPDEMEELMATWQQNHEPLTRDTYLKQLWWNRLMDYGSIAALVFGIVVFAYVVITMPSVFSASAAAFFVPYFAWGIWMVWNRLQAEVHALPKASRDYLDVMKHNLALRERENLWERRTIIPISIAAAFICAWQFERSSFSLTLVLAIGTVLFAVLPYAIYGTFVVKPKKLHKERERLDEMIRDSELGEV